LSSLTRTLEKEILAGRSTDAGTRNCAYLYTAKSTEEKRKKKTIAIQDFRCITAPNKMPEIVLKVTWQSKSTATKSSEESRKCLNNRRKEKKKQNKMHSSIPRNRHL
jgi:hypothetical protein